VGKSLFNVVVADGNQLFASGLETALAHHASLEIIQSVHSRDSLFAFLQASPETDILFACADLFCENIRSDLALLTAKYPHLLMIMMSDHADRAHIFDYLGAGAHGFFCKSESKQELHNAVSVVLSGRVFVPSEVPALPCGAPSEASLETLSNVGSLSHRQSQVLELLATGMSNKEIARALGIAEATVKVHIGAIFKQFGVHSRTGAVAQIRAAGSIRG
jgi:DNA-binding NarL/FixJ family response regulator